MARKRDPKASREAIEGAAAALFAEQGYAGTSTSQIAREAGVAEGTIFRHFKTKKALLLGVMAPMIRRFFAPIATRSLRAVLERRYDRLEDFLETLWLDRVELVRGHPHMVRILLQELSLQPEVAAIVKDVFGEHVLPYFGAQLQWLRDDGLLDPTLADAVVLRHIITTIASSLVLHSVYDLPLEGGLEEQGRTVVRLLSGALSPRAS